ncbi:alpha/beta hydrolase [Actinoallomurus oryzae]|uniref:alpha/beta hydrolase n=1 Tax=Actinoallomurus oryzae TaxID=502180 RepID=UPI0031E86106
MAQVPLDYRDPRGKTISVAVERHQATDSAHRIGSLFVNGGGPSEQLSSFTVGYKQLPRAWRARYDIVGFDLRGFGSSTAVKCFPTAEAEEEFLSGAPIGFPVGAKETSAWIRTWAGFDERCAKRNGGLLEHISTADAARDMDLLRQAVGDPQLNYMGLSYGTVLGATYANLFPAEVGHMALDGNLDAVAYSNGKDGLPTFLSVGNDQASAAVFKDFLDLCGKASTAACAFSAGTPAATHAKYITLLRRLRQHPVTIGDTKNCGYACGVLSIPLGSVSQWAMGADLLQQMWVASSGAAAGSAASTSSALSSPAVSAPAAATTSSAISSPAVSAPAAATTSSAISSPAVPTPAAATTSSAISSPAVPTPAAATTPPAISSPAVPTPAAATTSSIVSSPTVSMPAAATTSSAVPMSSVASMPSATSAAKLRARTTRSGSDAPASAVYTGHEQFLAMLCSDSPNPRDPSAYTTASRLAYATSGPMGLGPAWITEPCAGWPQGKDRYTGPWDRRTANPILLLNNTKDPATSYQGAVALSRELARARLLTVDGYGHTVFSNPSACAMEYETRYLLTGALPPAGTVCKQDATPFPEASEK